ncbi:MAG TPA: Rho-binding antiterminator [Thermoanaerobaculia bacterium]|nr:Rho-binding antiterminator [Thermoanaerobaculia bacterium]
MSEGDYEPVSCDYHDELEAAAVRRREVELEFDRKGVRQRERGRIGDVFTAGGAEWVRLEKSEGAIEIRLDEIAAFRQLP